MSHIVVAKDLRALFGPARNQGWRPTCLAFAASDAHAALRGAWAPLSCEYAFFHAQRRGRLSPHGGAYLWAMLEALKDDGQPEEAGWPYLASLPAVIATWAPPSSVGSLFARNGKTETPTLDDVIPWLDQDRPAVILTKLFPSFDAPSVDGVVDPAPGELLQPKRRHALVACGHGTVDGQRALLVRNSWGPKWGLAGYAWLTEAFLGPGLYDAAILMEDVHVSSHTVTA
jgi:hypothetical protein